MNQEQLMQEAFGLAEKGAGKTSPNPMVGAVVARDGRILGRGYHARFGADHAEVAALKDAGEKAAGADLYVTLEPCNHHGKTPPCTAAILAAGIRRVFVSVLDPNPGVKGGGLAHLAAMGVKTAHGLLEEQGTEFIEAFVKHAKTGRAFVVAKLAATLDGMIATRTKDARWVSGEDSRGFVHRLRNISDAICVGVGTILADDPSLTTRIGGQDGADPARIILDTRLCIPESAAVLRLKSESDTIIVHGPKAPADKRKKLKRPGVRLLEVPADNAGLCLDVLVEKLGKMGMLQVLLEGGSRVMGAAFKAKVVDKLCFFYAPKLLMGNDGVPVCFGKGAEKMADALKVENIRVRRFGDDVLITGYPAY